MSQVKRDYKAQIRGFIDMLRMLRILFDNIYWL